jgi:twinkle protein|tara:strand:- start:3290 stop:4987 length:1698 start_codon:yes stop_codon:yes gene_type:complete
LTYADKGIEVPDYITSGQYSALCPKCSNNRKKRNDKCLSVNIDEGIWYCHHCNWKGKLDGKDKPNKEKIVPIEYDKPDLPKEVVEWFKGRGISTETLKNEKIGFDNGYIKFPYYKDGKVVNIKYRGRGKKFKQEYKSEKCFYRFDSLKKGTGQVIICEGEMDALSIIESNDKTLGTLFNIVSVPDGASPPNSNPSDLKFSYLESAEDYLMNAKKVILAVDNDPAGIGLQKELSRRIGRERCFIVEYPDGCKDMNEVLLKHGHKMVTDSIKNARPYPVNGIVSISDVIDETISLLKEPEHKGLTTGWEHMDDRYRVSTGEVTAITGVPNHGKSEWLDALLINMVQLHLWKFAIFSAENRPIRYHLLKLLAKFTNKPFTGENKMSDEEAKITLDILDDRIKFIGTQEDDVTVDSILEQARILNYRYGINGLLIDPWNTVEHKLNTGETETNYISRMLSKINAFAKLHDIHIWIIAHPRKMEVSSDGKVSVPTLYDVSGSANWYNKIDNGLTIHRHRTDDDDYVCVYVGKIRHQYKNGKPGVVEFGYNINTGRYYERFRTEKNLFGEG